MPLLNRYINLDGSSARFRDSKLGPVLRMATRAENSLAGLFTLAACVPAYAQNPRQALPAWSFRTCT